MGAMADGRCFKLSTSQGRWPEMKEFEAGAFRMPFARTQRT